jgi:hypothetical protein
MLSMRLRGVAFSAAALAVGCFTGHAFADTLELADGRKLENCYVRDEGTRVLVWRQLADVGRQPEAFPRSAIKKYEIQRGPEWDRKPDLPDLSVTFIELDPKCYSLQGRIEYDKTGRPLPTGAPALKNQGMRDYMEPHKIIEGVRTNYRPGEELTLTAHVKNVGFAPSGPFRYTCLVDDKPVLEGRYTERLHETQEVTFAAKWKWETGLHTARFRIEPENPEIAAVNNELTDPLWGWGLIYIVNPNRVAAWRECRNAFGTFSWEDYYRWHIDLMNQLFADSVYPAAPEGIKARVRLDRIIYTTDVPAAEKARWKKNGLADDQGAHVWHDTPEEVSSGKWATPDHAARNQTEWSLLHALGYELGLPEYQALDYAGDDLHVTSDTGEKITHALCHRMQMMYRPGPWLFGEADAGYLNFTIDKPRGYHGDLYFALPRLLGVRVTDMSGRGVPGALVEFFQRGVKVEIEKEPGGVEDLKWWSVVEDGDFDHPVSKYPVMTARTDPAGAARLVPRPTEPVRTLNGFQRQLNGFGNIDTRGKRGLILARVTKDGQQAYFWLDITEAVTAWFRGQQELYEFALQTPFGSPDSPPAPRDVKAQNVGEHEVRITWSPPPIEHEQQYLGHIIGYRVYGRIGNDGLNDCPWFPITTLARDAASAIVDLRQFPQESDCDSGVRRYGVAAVGECSSASELAEFVLPAATATGGQRPRH